MSRVRKESGPAPLQTIDRALRVINYLADVGGELGVTEIARHIGIDPSSAYRILSTLTHHGYVEQNPDNTKYRLGLKLLTLGSRVSESLHLPELARPVLEHLVHLTGETTNLLVQDGSEGLYLAGVAGTKTLRRVVTVGRREPLHCSGVGKVILAHLPTERIDAIVRERGLSAVTRKTITNPDHLMKHLTEIRKQGYAIDDEEGEEGLRCIAAPIFDHKGESAAAISIAGPSFRLSLATLKQLSPTVMEAATQLSCKLGWRPAQIDR